MTLPLWNRIRRKAQTEQDIPAVRHFTTVSRCNEPLAVRLDVQPPRRSKELLNVFLSEAARALARELIRRLFEQAIKLLERCATMSRITRSESA